MPFPFSLSLSLSRSFSRFFLSFKGESPIGGTSAPFVVPLPIDPAASRIGLFILFVIREIEAPPLSSSLSLSLPLSRPFAHRYMNNEADRRTAPLFPACCFLRPLNVSAFRKSFLPLCETIVPIILYYELPAESAWVFSFSIEFLQLFHSYLSFVYILQELASSFFT